MDCKKMFRVYHSGFTLIELLVVIAIISLLMSIIVPALRRVKEEARFVLCANNQRQLLIGVLDYEASHGDVPTSIQGKPVSDGSEFWTDPFRINYYPKPLYPDESSCGFGGGMMSGLLGAYLPNAEIYSCPLSPPLKDFSRTDAVRGGTLSYQDAYETGHCNWVDCSYCLLWNYNGFDSTMNENGIRFKGPGKKSNTGLMVSDVLFRNDTAANLTDTWLSSHPGKNYKRESSHILYSWYDPDQVKPDVPMNAGYRDGHVQRYRATETYLMRVSTASYLECYITKKFR